jgi:subtilase family serine protease
MSPIVRISALASLGTAHAGSAINVSDTTQNFRPVPAGATTTRFFLARIGSPDVALGARSVPSLGPGGSSSGTTAVTIPAGTALGLYSLKAVADADNAVSELNETNNARLQSLIIN